MNATDIKTKLSAILPLAQFEEGGEWLNVIVESHDWKELARNIRTDKELNLDYLFCLTCIDWKTHLTMVYHLSSTVFRHSVVIKSKLDRSAPEIETVSDIWKGAEFYEREVFEMFGVNFLHHPDLRILILPEGWEGKNPMRKDFEDPVNMIRL